jgi:hypothetical protein
MIPFVRLKFWMLIIENFQNIEHDRPHNSCRGFDIGRNFIGRTSSFHHLTGVIHSVKDIKHQVIDSFATFSSDITTPPIKYRDYKGRKSQLTDVSRKLTPSTTMTWGSSGLHGGNRAERDLED